MTTVCMVGIALVVTMLSKAQAADPVATGQAPTTDQNLHWWEQLADKNLKSIDREPFASGSFGKVYLANLDGQQVAVKEISDLDDFDDFNDEVAFHFTCKDLSRFIIDIKFGHMNQGLKRAIIVTEYGGPVTLDQLYNEYSYADMNRSQHKTGESYAPIDDSISRLARCRYFARCCALAIIAMHRSSLLHGDIKPANIVVSLPDGHLKLIDFGLCRYVPVGKRLKLTDAGSPLYQSPEVLNRETYGEDADWFSLGVSLLLINQLIEPFRHRFSLKEELIAWYQGGNHVLDSEPDQSGFGPEVIQTIVACCHGRVRSEAAAAALDLLNGSTGVPECVVLDINNYMWVKGATVTKKTQ